MAHEEYRKMIPPPAELPYQCPCCGCPDVVVWEHSETPESIVTRVVTCESKDVIGPRGVEDGGFGERGCLLFMPPRDFYRPTGREAVRYWNKYAAALLDIKIKNAMAEQEPQ